MKRLALTIGLLVVLGALPAAASDGRFLSLCYHNVEDENPDQSMNGISSTRLVEQFNWLQSEGYTAVSIDDLIAARDGKKPLPEKAVLLSFDDGYASFYTRVFPLLQAYHFPAVLGLVDVWMTGKTGEDGHGGGKVKYGDKLVPRSTFLTWEQVKEMQKSGLVEIASHSHDLHRGIPANPQGNSEPAAVTARYDNATKTYESASAYRKRLEKDAKLSVETIEKNTGKKPRVMIWPYGAYNQISLDVQKKFGMPITLTLDAGYASVSNLTAIPRYLSKGNPDLPGFVSDMRSTDKQGPVRVVQIDLDYIYDPDPAQQERNLSDVISRIYKLGVSTVYLQAFADPKGDGLARQLYFPNRHLPMRADLLNRVVWQLKQRAHVRVYGWLPVLSYDFKDAATVLAWHNESHKSDRDPKSYRRISPFDEKAKAKILGIYEDMARSTAIDGVLFHDDALLSDFEDASAPALKAYQAAGFPSSIEAIRADASIMKKWSEFKINALIMFTQALAERAKRYRLPLLTVRNIYAPVVLNPESQDWFAQDYDRFLESYDYTAVMAMPKMEGISDDLSEAWLDNLVTMATMRPNGLKRTIFELQTVDWRKKKDEPGRVIPADVLGSQMRLLARKNALNFGYYPDDFIKNVPDIDALHKDFSLQSFPYLP